MGRDAWERAATDAERELDGHAARRRARAWLARDVDELVRHRPQPRARAQPVVRRCRARRALRRARPSSARHAAGHRARRDRPSPRAGEVAGAAVCRCCRSATAWAASPTTDLPVYRPRRRRASRSARGSGSRATIAAAAVPAWHEMINGPADDKLGLLADAEWRARARHDWDHPLDEQNSFRKEQLHALILSDSENGTGPEGVSLQDLAEERGLHPSDALADWVLANGIGSRYTKLAVRPQDTTARDGRAGRSRASTIRTRSSAAPTPARTSRCSAARARTCTCSRTGPATRPRVGIEQAVHCMTQRNAAFFSLHDRGVIETGKRGDLAVFALDEIETRELRARPRPARRRMALHAAERGLPRHDRRRHAHRARRRAHRRTPHHHRQRHPLRELRTNRRQLEGLYPVC